MTKRNRIDVDHERRMRWWRDARFGMFVHWGPYAVLGRDAWVLNRERIPLAEYEKLGDAWQPRPKPMRQWARLAKAAGMKYVVLTAKHHDGFCLWNTRQTDFNAVQRGPRRDLLREYVDACREFGLKVGFYYSLSDWHHPDGDRCRQDPKARRRFIDFTHACVGELCRQYGKIDILWYDMSWGWPSQQPEFWESAKLNTMARRWQPGLIINQRSGLPEDFGTSEERITPAKPGRDWEACVTFNGTWGYQPTRAEDWKSVRAVLEMLRTVASCQGNLLLNVGPKADGSLPAEATQRLERVGRWLRQHGEACYGRQDYFSFAELDWMLTGNWTARGRAAYFWCSRWPGSELTIGGFHSRLQRATLLDTGRRLRFTQTKDRLVLHGLPRECPDKIAGVAVIKLECQSAPRCFVGPSYPGSQYT